MKRSFMLDCETVGKRPTSAVVQIGIVEMCMVKLEIIGTPFFIRLDPEDQFKRGATYDFDTLQWWLNTNSDWIKNAFNKRDENDPALFWNPLSLALPKLSNYLGSGDKDIWTCGWNDCAWVSNLYDMGGYDDLNRPYSFNSFRDYRTVREENDVEFQVAYLEVGQNKDAHNALADATHQAKLLLSAKRFLRDGIPAVSPSADADDEL